MDRVKPTLYGRDSELSTLEQCLHGDSPWVVMIHGLGGIGKTTLLREFGRRAQANGRRVLHLDCQEIEPTESGFLAAVGDGLGAPLVSASELAEHFEAPATPLVLLLDHYEVFRLMDSWLRRSFLSAAAGRVRLFIATREAPLVAWTRDPIVGRHITSLQLSSLTDSAAREMLDCVGIDEQVGERIRKLTGGHPLAIRLAQLACEEVAGAHLVDLPLDRVLSELTRFYVGEIEDPQVRAAVEAASAVRRVNESMLGAMLSTVDPTNLYHALEQLHFITSRRDGLTIHDAVKPFIAAELRSRDPSRFAQYRRAAWRRLREELRQAPSTQLWSYTADLIFLIDNPVIREAFFPTAEPIYAVEPARVEDLDEIVEIVTRHDSPAAARLMEHWWSRSPSAFYVARDARAQVAGFYCALDSDTVDPADFDVDPVTRRWWEDLVGAGPGDVPRALFLRRWLGREDGERPSPVQAACWLDLKRKYLELRPYLRHVYLAVRDLGPYRQVAARLGFAPLDGEIAVGDAVYRSARLDFGPESVDGWITRLLRHELGELDTPATPALDVDARQLLTENGRCDLSPLEFGVMKMLVDGAGKSIPRERLLEQVWGIRYDSASNVVDTVVRSLRKKLAAQAACIETVRGVGYRFVRSPG